MKIFEGIEIQPKSVAAPVDEAALFENIQNLTTELISEEDTEEVVEYLDAA